MADYADYEHEKMKQEATHSVPIILSESESDDSSYEEEILKNKRVVEFILNANENVPAQQFSDQKTFETCINSPKTKRQDFRKRCLKKLHLNTQTGSIKNT